MKNLPGQDALVGKRGIRPGHLGHGYGSIGIQQTTGGTLQSEGLGNAPDILNTHLCFDLEGRSHVIVDQGSPQADRPLVALVKFRLVARDIPTQGSRAQAARETGQVNERIQ